MQCVGMKSESGAQAAIPLTTSLDDGVPSTFSQKLDLVTTSGVASVLEWANQSGHN